MKRVMIGFVMIVFANEGAAHRINLSMDEASSSVKVSCDDFLQVIKAGEAVNLGNFATGHWNGTSFFMSRSVTLPTEEVEIFSNAIPVTFDSFLSEKCNIHAPGVRIMGETKISDFAINLIESTKNALDIVGTLITKCIDIVGSILINGRLISIDELKIDTTKSFMAKVVNNGEISSGSGVISFATKDFINSEHGQICGDHASFLINGQFQNSGILEFNQFSLNLMSEMIAVAETGFNPIRFIQMGEYIIHNQASLACNFESFGRTQINLLVFPYPSRLITSGGQAIIGQISGKMSLIQTKDSAKTKIGDVKDGVDFVESLGGHLVIERLHSDRKPVFSTKSGGSIAVKQADVDKSFMYSEDGILAFSDLKGESSAFVHGTAKLSIQGASQVKLVTGDEAKVLVGESNVTEAHLLGREQASFIRSNVDSVSNKGKVTLVDTKTVEIKNQGEIILAGATTTGKISDSGKTTFKTGRHNVSEYRSSNSKLEVKGQESSAITDSGIVTEDAVLMDNDAMVSIAKFRGMGSVDAEQQAYIQILPTFLHTKGDVRVFLDHMPKPAEIPLHDGGTFMLSVNMNEDFINTSDIDYGNVMISMDMQGHIWENREAAFLAGGLKVDRALHFGNTDGLIRLRKILDVHAGKIFDIAHPIAGENGRWIDDWSNWRARLIYCCPATYYSANTHTGIEVTDGNIILKSETDIANRFSKICATGTLTASAAGNFDNIVGYIVALGRGESSIKAENIINACLPAFLRRGEAYATGKSGWGWNRRRWHAYSYTAELITQSHGSGILFGGDAKLDGHTRNFGSKIFTLGALQGDVDSVSLFENAARHGALGTALEGEDLRFTFPSIFAHEDLFASKE